MKYEILKINNRIHLLNQRDPIINKNIINKLKRALRRLTTEN